MSGNPAQLRLLLFCLFATLGASCAAGNNAKDVNELLPYHVAIASAKSAYYVNETPLDSDAENLGYDLVNFVSEDATAGEASPDLVKRLARELRNELFSQATVVEATTRGAGAERNLELVHAARELGADMLMTIEEVVYDRSETESKAKPLNWFWYFTGPLELLINDRWFRIDATAEVALYDLNTQELVEALEQETDPLVPSALVRRFRAKPDRIETRFIERAEGGWDYLKCIVVPSNLLRRDGREVALQVAEDSLDSLAEVLVQNISVDADFVSRPTSRGNFYLESDGGTEFKTEIKLDDKQEFFELTAHLLLDSSQEEARPPTCVIRVASGALLDGDAGQGGVSITIEDPPQREIVDKWVRKIVRARIPVEAAYAGTVEGAVQVDRSLQLILKLTGARSESRSWTFRIPKQERLSAIRAIEARLDASELVQPRSFTYDPTQDR